MRKLSANINHQHRNLQKLIKSSPLSSLVTTILIIVILQNFEIHQALKRPLSNEHPLDYFLIIIISISSMIKIMTKVMVITISSYWRPLRALVCAIRLRRNDQLLPDHQICLLLIIILIIILLLLIIIMIKVLLSQLKIRCTQIKTYSWDNAQVINQWYEKSNVSVL